MRAESEGGVGGVFGGEVGGEVIKSAVVSRPDEGDAFDELFRLLRRSRRVLDVTEAVFSLSEVSAVLCWGRAAYYFVGPLGNSFVRSHYVLVLDCRRVFANIASPQDHPGDGKIQ
jgi:hypothetical protein